MADNESKVQHVTELDFITTKAVQQLKDLEAQVNAITEKIKNSNWNVNAMVTGTGEIGQLKTQLEAAQKEIIRLKEQMRSMAASGTLYSSKLVSYINSRLVYAFRNVAREAKDMAQEVEDSMMGISRVLNLTAEQSDVMKDKLFEIGQEYGRSFGDVSEVATRFVQAGWSMTDAIDGTRDAMLALNTAELNVQNSTQSLIGIINQWGLEESDLITIIDKLNYTADNNAVTTQDLVDGLLKASSVAKTAGISFDDTVGVLTAMKVASGAAGKEVGNAFKSIVSYIQRPKSLEAFDDMGIEVFKDKVTGELLPMMDILQNMSDKWNSNQEQMLNTLIKSGDAAQMMSQEWAIATDSLDEYNDYQEAAAEATDKANTAEARAQAQAAAGVFRRNYYISLMENFNKALEVSKDLENAEGHSLQENSRYMETLTAKTEQLVASLTQLAVTAADSGLMDFAKDCVDTASAIVQWTSKTQNIIPVITVFTGLLATLKADKIATEVNAIFSAFGNGAKTLAASGKAMLGMKAAADSTTTSLEGTAAAAGTLNSALGAIGLAITAVSLVVMAVKSATTALHEERQELIESGKEIKSNAEQLNELQKKYDEFNEMQAKTSSQEEEYKNVQDEIVKLLGSRAEALSGLTKGTDEYIKKLKELVEAEKGEYLAKLTEARDAAEKEMNKANRDIRLKFNYEQHISYSDLGTQLLVDKGIARDNGNDARLEFYNNPIENYTYYTNAFKTLNEEYTRLIELNERDQAEQLVLGDTYQMVEERVDSLAGSVKNYVAALVAEEEENWILKNGTPQTFAEQKKLNDVIWARIGLTDDYKEMVNSLIPVYYEATDAQKAFLDVLKSDKYSEADKLLREMATNGSLDKGTFKQVISWSDGLIAEISRTGMSVDDCVTYLNSLYVAAEDAADVVNDLSKEIDAVEGNISDLNGYLQELSEGNGLTAEEVMNLCDTYGLLASQFTETEKGYVIEKSALEQLREAQILSAKVARQTQLEQTMVLQTNLIERIKAYGIEISSIATLAEAQAGYTKALQKLNGMSVNSQADAEKAAELGKIVAELKAIADGYQNIEDYSDEFYKKLGETYDEKEKKEEKEVDSLSIIMDSYQRLADMGVYSAEEQIAALEELRRSMNLTEEQYKQLEDALFKLYEQQTKKYMENLEEQHDAKIKAIEDEYDKEKEALEKTLDEETEERKEYYENELERVKDSLNAQIKAAKAAYDAKKKLTQKSYDGQIEALENLKSTELDNIKSIYDAQISALEKIKKAREADRDTEDYNEERANLLEQLSYWEQRTGTEAVENVEDVKKQIEELDKNRKRELEDDQIDGQIDTLKEQRDKATNGIEKSYQARINALKASQQEELDAYEETYNKEAEMLQAKLDKEVKALEDKRDKELKQLEKDKEKKLQDLEDTKNKAIELENQKWALIQELFTEENLKLIAASGVYAGKIYDMFNTFFTMPMTEDINQLKLMLGGLSMALPAVSSAVSSGTGNTPTTSAPRTVTTTASTSSTALKLGTSVKVSGTIYSDSTGKTAEKTVYGQKGTITSIKSSAKKPYKIDDLGWTDKASLVKAKTGGYTLADGLALLHKNELVVNPPLVQGLKAVVDPKIINGLQKMAEYYNRGSTTNNSYNNSRTVSNSSSVIQNFNAPLQVNERIEDNADMNAAVNKLERALNKKINMLM